MEIEISVILPCYNVEKYLSRSLECLIGQSLRKIEVLCVDDGSSDSTPQILDSYAARDSRITVIHQENGGAGPARNVGIDRAKGEYLFFCDPDDWCSQDMLEQMYQSAKKQDVDVLFVSHYVCEGDDDTIVDRRNLPPRLVAMKQTFAAADVAKNCFQLFSHVPWNKLFKAAFVRETGLRFQNLPRSNDAFFVEAAFAAAARVKVLDQAYYYHRVRRPGSLVAASDRHPMTGYAARDGLRIFLKNRGLFERLGGSWAKAVFLSAISDIPGLSNLSAVESSYREIRHRLCEDPDMAVLREDGMLNQARRELYDTIVSNEDVRPFLLAALRARKRTIGELQRQRWQLLGNRSKWMKALFRRMGWIGRV